MEDAAREDVEEYRAVRVASVISDEADEYAMGDLAVADLSYGKFLDEVRDGVERHFVLVLWQNLDGENETAAAAIFEDAVETMCK